mmetsp:Transcript_1583/g.5614  ORF Transcript_1583/g.5614 Transcript_1583/m.5614 type:complete len:220 (+) Transcript_1583:89-748(+)
MSSSSSSSSEARKDGFCAPAAAPPPKKPPIKALARPRTAENRPAFSCGATSSVAMVGALPTAKNVRRDSSRAAMALVVLPRMAGSVCTLSDGLSWASSQTTSRHRAPLRAQKADAPATAEISSTPRRRDSRTTNATLRLRTSKTRTVPSDAPHATACVPTQQSALTSAGQGSLLFLGPLISVASPKPNDTASLSICTRTPRSCSTVHANSRRVDTVTTH